MTRLGRILRSDTAVPDMAQLNKLTKGNQVARDGIKKGIVELIERDLTGNKLAGDTGTNYLKGDAFQTFTKRTEDALRQFFTPGEVQSIRNVAADVQRSSRQPPTAGSATAHDQHDAAAHGSHSPSTVSSVLIAEMAGRLAEHAVGAVGHAVEPLLLIRNAMRAVGMKKVDQLRQEATLSPDLMRALLSKAHNGRIAPARAPISAA